MDETLVSCVKLKLLFDLSLEYSSLNHTKMFKTHAPFFSLFKFWYCISAQKSKIMYKTILSNTNLYIIKHCWMFLLSVCVCVFLHLLTLFCLKCQ